VIEEALARQSVKAEHERRRQWLTRLANAAAFQADLNLAPTG